MKKAVFRIKIGEHGQNRDPLETLQYPDDADVKQLQDATNLERLVLDNSKVTSRGLQHLAELKKLKRLEFKGMEDADNSVKVIATFPSIEYLAISDSTLTNEAASQIAKMQKLRYLDISNTKIDSGFFARPPCRVP
ncbi:hypothetical protein [Blastopirellula marina]|uniref:Zer-1-like leucine-rich repeats region domain-containing protein n=1 Tax=Blastopirellula marina TaxID=124 RepID=A0A2S8G977_9BACT|nr:hypothetical protein [Blastopirellula marina]PQO41018.1 hypothetical protein C5Y98_03380 [Blastopirellula marina]PTL45894.1 hypothetical protein C5Y97_03380 [Blastopirellula marina]